MLIDFRELANNSLSNITETNEKHGLSNVDSINVGNLTNLDHLYVQLFEAWTKKIDSLDLELKDSIYWRGFSLQEYYQLFDESIKNYDLYPAFRFLMIETETGYAIGEHTIYGRRDYTDMFEKTVDGFIQCLKKTATHILRLFDDKNSLRHSLPLSVMEAHTYVFGGTKRGKSTLIRHIHKRLVDDYRFTHIVLDPHGLLASDMLKTKIGKIIYLDLYLSRGYTFSFNLLDIPDKEEKTIAFASGNIVSVLSEILGGDISDAQTPMLQHVTEFLLRRQYSTMDDFLKLLNIEETILAEAQRFRPSYFNEIFIKGDVGKTRSALYNRFDGILNNMSLRRVLMGDGTISLEKEVKKAQTIVFNLGGFPDGRDKENMGKLIMTYIKNFLFKREGGEGQPLFFYIDEFQAIENSNYEVFLSQMRKYNVRLVLANQYPKQLKDNRTIESIKNNVGIKIGASSKAEQMRSVMTVPNRYVTKSEEGDEGKVKLGKYQFLVDCLFRNVQVIKAPSFLYKSKYQYTEEQVERIVQKQVEKYYKIYGVHEQKKETYTIKNDLILQGETDYKTSEFDYGSMDKKERVLRLLAQYKFLTQQQMIDLGVTNNAPNLPTKELELAKMIAHNRQKTNIYYLTPKGATYLTNLGVEKVNVPNKKLDNFTNWQHTMFVTDDQIQFSKYNMVMCSKDVDNSGVQHQRATRCGDTESDMIFILQTPKRKELYCYEFENTTSHGYTYDKFLQHKELMLHGDLNKMLSFENDYRVLFVFNDQHKLNNILSKVKKESQLKEHFLFRMRNDSIYDGWVNCEGEKRYLFYY